MAAPSDTMDFPKLGNSTCRRISRCIEMLFNAWDGLWNRVRLAVLVDILPAVPPMGILRVYSVDKPVCGDYGDVNWSCGLAQNVKVDETLGQCVRKNQGHSFTLDEPDRRLLPLPCRLGKSSSEIFQRWFQDERQTAGTVGVLSFDPTPLLLGDACRDPNRHEYGQDRARCLPPCRPHLRLHARCAEDPGAVGWVGHGSPFRLGSASCRAAGRQASARVQS